MSAQAFSNENFWHQFLMSMMIDHFHAHCHDWTLKELCDSSWRGHLEIIIWVLSDLVWLFFPSSNFAVYPGSVKHHYMTMCY